MNRIKPSTKTWSTHEEKAAENMRMLGTSAEENERQGPTP